MMLSLTKSKLAKQLFNSCRYYSQKRPRKQSLGGVLLVMLVAFGGTTLVVQKVLKLRMENQEKKVTWTTPDKLPVPKRVIKQNEDSEEMLKLMRKKWKEEDYQNVPVPKDEETLKLPNDLRERLKRQLE